MASGVEASIRTPYDREAALRAPVCRVDPAALRRLAGGLARLTELSVHIPHVDIQAELPGELGQPPGPAPPLPGQVGPARAARLPRPAGYRQRRLDYGVSRGAVAAAAASAAAAARGASA